MHFDFGFKHSARLLTCTLLLMLLAGCSLGAAKYADVSGEPDNQKLMSSRWTTNDDLLFLGIDSYPGKRRIVSFRLVPRPGFDGPEVLSRSVLPSGTQLTVIGARRCTNCWGETSDELMVTVDGFAREQPIYIRKYFLNYLTPTVVSEAVSAGSNVDEFRPVDTWHATRRYAANGATTQVASNLILA